MFSNLVESASHQQDLARKGRFFLATLISYALIVTCAGLVSIYAYDTHVENQDLEFLGLVPPIIPNQVSQTRSMPRSSSNNRQTPTVAQRTEAIDRVAAPTKIPNEISSTSLVVPEIPKSGEFTIGPSNIDATFTGPPSSDNSGGPSDGGSGRVVEIVTPPPPIMEKSTEPPQPKMIHRSIVNGLAKSLPLPPYPSIAKAARAQGPVNVQITIDETGKIVSARAASGNPLLRGAAEKAAYQARFNPTFLNGVPVKVSGIIVYNFTLQ